MYVQGVDFQPPQFLAMAKNWPKITPRPAIFGLNQYKNRPKMMILTLKTPPRGVQNPPPRGPRTPPEGSQTPPRGGLRGGTPPQRAFSIETSTKIGQKPEKSGKFEKFPGGGPGNPKILVGNPISKLPKVLKNTPPRGGGTPPGGGGGGTPPGGGPPRGGAPP